MRGLVDVAGVGILAHLALAEAGDGVPVLQQDQVSVGDGLGEEPVPQVVPRFLEQLCRPAQQQSGRDQQPGEEHQDDGD